MNKTTFRVISLVCAVLMLFVSVGLVACQVVPGTSNDTTTDASQGGTEPGGDATTAGGDETTAGDQGGTTTDGASGDVEELCHDIARDLQPHRLIYTEKLAAPEGNPAFEQAADYCMAGMWQHAARAAEAAVQQTPHEPEAHYLQGLIQRQLENYTASDICFDKAYQLRPDTRYAEASKINKLMQMGARYVRHQMKFNSSEGAAFNKGTLPAYHKKEDTPWSHLFFHYPLKSHTQP